MGRSNKPPIYTTRRPEDWFDPTASIVSSADAVLAARTINTTAPIQGGGNLGTDLTLSLSGTKAEFNTACSDGNFLFVGDVVAFTSEDAQDAVGGILTDSASIDFTYNDGANTITAVVKANSIGTNELVLGDVQEISRDAVGAALVAGTNITITVDDALNTITIDAAGASGYTDEQAQDAIAAAFAAGTHTGITITYTDASNKFDFVNTITQYTDEMAQDAVGGALVDSSTIDFTYNDAANTITASVIDLGALHVANVTPENAGGAIGSYQSRGLNTVVSNSISGATAIPSATVTITIATPGVVTWTAHGLTDGTPVCFTTTQTLPTGITANFTYYVINSTTNTFQISLSTGGAAINTTGSQLGTHTCFAGQFTLPAGTYDINSTGQGIFSGTAAWRSRLYNITDAAEQSGTLGSSMSGNVNAERVFTLIGRFTISGTKTFQIQTICTGSVATFGLGLDGNLPSSISNVFTNTFIRRVA